VANLFQELIFVNNLLEFSFISRGSKEFYISGYVYKNTFISFSFREHICDSILLSAVTKTIKRSKYIS